jgi:hypothetical protein
LIRWGRKVETKLHIKRDKSGGTHDNSGVLKRDVNELKSVCIYISHAHQNQNKLRNVIPHNYLGTFYPNAMGHGSS